MTIHALVETTTNLVRRYEELDSGTPQTAADESSFVVSAVVDFTSRPTPYHELKYISGTTTAWVDARTLTIAKDYRWSVEEAELHTAETAPFTWSGHVFKTDTDSWLVVLEAGIQAALATFGGTGYTRTMRDASGGPVTMDKNDIGALLLAMSNYRQSLYDATFVTKAALAAATTVAQVDAIP